jgi:Flp pilus assembly pilin Flp
VKCLLAPEVGVKSMKTFLALLVKEVFGASAIEYGMITALISVAIILGAKIMGGLCGYP